MTSTVQAESTAQDFDFWMGTWTCRNRRLKRRLAGSEDWEEFDSWSVARPLFGGHANEDEFHTEHGRENSVGTRLKPGTHAVPAGMSFRFFDSETRQWSIYWADSRRLGVLDPPVTGAFDGGVGIFEGEDVWNGRPILVRFTWSRVDTPTPRWEQAFSDDGGRTWETNWIADFTRAEDAP